MRIFLPLIGLIVVIGGYIIVGGGHASTCTVDANLVNSCRPWIGGIASGYPVGSDWKASILDHEARIGRQMDVVHQYHTVGNLPLSAEEIYFIDRPNTILYANWKPADPWINAAGGNASVNAQIDQAAANIKAVSPHKIMLTLYHEPENNVSSGNCTGNANGASSGSPADYVAMWQNVHNRFAADGVTNVVWVMNYMGFSNWDCLVKPMWPGNNYVDWVTWDPYVSNSDFVSDTGRFYNVLTNDTDAAHAFTSKPWGLAEYGFNGSSQANAYAYYDNILGAVKNNTFPRLKMYLDYDAPGIWDTRIDYTSTGVLDDIEQNHYKAFVNDSALTVSTTASTSTPTPVLTALPTRTPSPTPTPTPEPTPSPTPVPTPIPTPVPTATPVPNLGDIAAPSIPSSLAVTLITDTQISIAWHSSTDNVGVKGYRVYRNGLRISDQTGLSYLSQSLAASTTYVFAVEAYDAAGNVSSQTALTSKTQSAPATTGSPVSGGGNPIVIVPSGSSTPVAIPSGAQPVVGGTVHVGGASSQTSSSVVKVDGATVSSNGSLDTTYLTNGVHTVTVTDDGATASRRIVVANNLNIWQTIRNTALSAFHGNKNMVNGVVGGVILVLVVIAVWFGRGFVLKRRGWTVRTNVR